MVPPDKAKSILQVVEQHLLTPYGLRSLSPTDPQYRGRYEGDPRSRDGAYHQGTVWPWLIGPFVTAWKEANGGERAAAVDRRTSALYAGRRRRADSGSFRWRRAASARRVHCAGMERGGGVTSFRVILLLLATMLSDVLWSAQPQHARQAMVVSGDPAATDTGLAVLKAGGNAMDAATAMAFVLGVTHSAMTGLGGGGHVLVRMHDGRTAFFDFREQAPGKASRGMFLDGHGNLSPDAVTGWRAAAVPGYVKGWEAAHRRFGVEAVEGTVAARDSAGRGWVRDFLAVRRTCSARRRTWRAIRNRSVSSSMAANILRRGTNWCSPTWRGRWNGWPTAGRRSSTKARPRTASPTPRRRTAADHAGRSEGVHGSRTRSRSRARIGDTTS